MQESWNSFLQILKKLRSLQKKSMESLGKLYTPAKGIITIVKEKQNIYKMEKREYIRDNKHLIVWEDGTLELPDRVVSFYSEVRGKQIDYVRKGRIAKQSVINTGYMRGGGMLAHRAVAFAFLGEPELDTHTVNHIDSNKLNNHYKNLEWVPHSQNVKHYHHTDRAIDTGRVHPVEVHTIDGEYVGVYRMKSIAAKELGLHKSTISFHLQGRFKQTGGYTFKRITKETFYEKRETEENNRNISN